MLTRMTIEWQDFKLNLSLTFCSLILEFKISIFIPIFFLFFCCLVQSSSHDTTLTLPQRKIKYFFQYNTVVNIPQYSHNWLCYYTFYRYLLHQNVFAAPCCTILLSKPTSWATNSEIFVVQWKMVWLKVDTSLVLYKRQRSKAKQKIGGLDFMSILKDWDMRILYLPTKPHRI